MQFILMSALIAVTFGVAYLCWIRPILRETPTLKDFYSVEESWFAALKLKFSGIKSYLTAAVGVTAAFIVESWDQLAPFVSQSGIDVTTLTDKIPPKAWPLIFMFTLILMNKFRRIADRQHEQRLKEAVQSAAIQASIAPDLMSPVVKAS